MHHPGSPTYVQPDSNAVGLSQSMSAMAIDPPSRRHTRAYEHAACPSSPGHWHPPQHPPSPPHPRRACTSPSAARAAGRHLGTQLLTMTPVNHDHSKTSGSALTSDEDSPTTDEPSTEGSSRTSSSFAQSQITCATSSGWDDPARCACLSTQCNSPPPPCVDAAAPEDDDRRAGCAHGGVKEEHHRQPWRGRVSHCR